MAWSAPRTWSAGELVTAAYMNQDVRDNENALRSGGIALSSQAASDIIYASSSTQFARLAVSGTTGKVLTTAGGGFSWGGDVNMEDSLISRPTLKDYAEAAYTLTSATSITIDIAANGNHYILTANHNVTWTFSNPSPTGSCCAFTLMIVNDGTARTMTWPAAVRWAAATAPTMTGTNGKVDIMVFRTVDAGTNWFAATFGQNM